MLTIRTPCVQLQHSVDMAHVRMCGYVCLRADKIRGHYEKLLQSDVKFERQCGTAMWVIDRLALRVGGEKDEVCCCLKNK